MKNSIQDSILESGFSITHISKKTGVSRKTIYNIIQGKIPTEKTKNRILQGLTNKVDWLSLKKIGGKVTVEAQYLIDLQNDKIKSQADKILSLEKQLMHKPITFIGGNIPDWNTIEYDVKTTQSYKPVNCLFSKYKMDDYVKFFKYLGYNSSEAKYVWERHSKYMTSTKTYNKEDFMRNSPFVNIKETDELIVDQLSTLNFFESNIKANIVSVIQVAKCVYIHKNGSHVLANITVLFDIINYRSESKIKFLEVN